jgi:hypothetical protein
VLELGHPPRLCRVDRDFHGGETRNGDGGGWLGTKTRMMCVGRWRLVGEAGRESGRRRRGSLLSPSAPPVLGCGT